MKKKMKPTDCTVTNSGAPTLTHKTLLRIFKRFQDKTPIKFNKKVTKKMFQKGGQFEGITVESKDGDCGLFRLRATKTLQDGKQYAVDQFIISPNVGYSELVRFQFHAEWKFAELLVKIEKEKKK